MHLVSDEQITIRRVCGCGKPAGHNSICRPQRRSAGLEPDKIERVSDAFEDLTTERAHGRYERRRRDFDNARRQERAGMDALTLHRWISEQAARMSTVKASTVGRSAPSSDEPSGVPRQQQLDDDPRWREHMSVIRRRLELAAGLIDEQMGHGTVAAAGNMLGMEKDKLILSSDNHGLRAQAVVDRLGSHIAGTAETVRRVRRREGLNHYGYPRDEMGNATDIRS
jgi:hypothetical protein